MHGKLLIPIVVLVAALAGCKTQQKTREDLSEQDRQTKQEIVRLMQAYHNAKLENRGPIRDQLLARGGPGERAIYGYLTAIFRNTGKAVTTKEGIKSSTGVTDELLKWARNEFVAVMGKTENRGMIFLLANLKTNDEVAHQWTIQVLVRCKAGKVKVEEPGQEPEWVVASELVHRIYGVMRESRALPRYRIALIEAIAAMEAAQSDLELMAFYQELAGDDWKLRGRMLQAMGVLDCEEAGSVIQAALSDQDPGVRMLARRAEKKRTRRARRKPGAGSR